MKQFSISFLFIIIVQLTNAQIFGGGGGLIPENGVTTSFPIAISTLTAEQLNADFGLLAAAININHNHVDDLEVYLVAPDGKTIALTTFNGSNGDNYTYTKFSDYATQPITSGWAPFSGTWLPEERLGELNNGQNGNGIWTLNIRDGVANNREGTLLGWSLTFGANATTPFNFTSSNLPIVIIDTYGQEIPDDPKIMVSLKIIDNGQGIRN
ncbi:MAG TPA: proprotein convertase P-domain-containing protein, partial [Bacteroidales bacterium]|nr:proprotein convertase P-domain-containing protein [Bacteroidales bacterium]